MQSSSTFCNKKVVDEGKKHIITNYQAVIRVGKAIDSDHNTQYFDFDLKIESMKPERTVIYDFEK